jgi:hypothetical protein
VRQQEAAALKAELQQTAAAAEAVAAQHAQDMQQLRRQHAAQLAKLEAQNTQHLQQQLQEAAEQHKQQLVQLGVSLRSQLQQELSTLHEALAELQCQQQEAAAWASSAAAVCSQERSVLVSHWQQQLQDVRAQLEAVQADAQQVVNLAGSQQAAVQALQQHQARLAPQGLEALAQQVQEAAAARCVHAGREAPCKQLCA